MKAKIGVAIVMAILCAFMWIYASREERSVDYKSFAGCLAEDVLDLIRDGASEQEKADALRHIFAFYSLSLNQSATFTDDETKEISKYTHGPGGSVEANRYFSDKSARLLMDEGLLKLTNFHTLSPSHPKSEKHATIDLKKCIEEYLQGMKAVTEQSPAGDVLKPAPEE
ncbi:MAG: hypothetical protein ACI8W8_002238 [Rhodothermales bacterium]|jgi:hypothetical protein